MDESYDAIICGTGLVECILSGLLSKKGMKVLHIDRNKYYGGEGASLNIQALFKRFKNVDQAPEQYGKNRDWNLDLIPKFIMSQGNLVKLLIKTDVQKYLDWQTIQDTYVYQFKKDGFFSSGGAKISKVPATANEALQSDLMGLIQKNYCKSFLSYVEKFDEANPKTHKYDLQNSTMRKIYKDFGLTDSTIEFIGHTVALYTNDSYIDEPCLPTLRKIKVYINSAGAYGNTPFIYPVYGLAGIPEGFSRMSALNGGTYMLDVDIDDIQIEDGKFTGIIKDNVVTKANILICDPTYIASLDKYKQRVKVQNKVIRCICILNHKIKKIDGHSVQIIMPQNQIKRKNDIFITMLSNKHKICPNGYYIFQISTILEGDDYMNEIKPALDLLGDIKEQFVQIYDQYEALEQNNNIFISNSMSAQSHFEEEIDNVVKLYKQITGEDLSY